MGANLSTPTTLFSFNPTLHHKCKYWLNVCAHRADFMVRMKQFLWNMRGDAFLFYQRVCLGLKTSKFYQQTG